MGTHLYEGEGISAFSVSISPEERLDDKTLYRMIYSFVDPVMRARVLMDVLKESKNPLKL